MNGKPIFSSEPDIDADSYEVAMTVRAASELDKLVIKSWGQLMEELNITDPHLAGSIYISGLCQSIDTCLNILHNHMGTDYTNEDFRSLVQSVKDSVDLSMNRYLKPEPEN